MLQCSNHAPIRSWCCMDVVLTLRHKSPASLGVGSAANGPAGGGTRRPRQGACA